ncbi:ParB/RepB/Spo0J family partition protein [Campylobacter sp. faydin G-140]|uniref:ParB/RepB/Spo0J family partition protein n=1 Tax=Campylobacter anatolicus TaxID=2829105 RepID=UPI001B9C7A64|nr:ParB/RepB/Spo0J family partition protein [Campylobacter anatolicus]MBR8461876.1 ParB/RepB/Spo0J family partition protein [Campylobacter anatolicus]MBR8465033.1 ParB/RepB/Spo0J family partition protein [Campylobacter anatolicus]
MAKKNSLGRGLSAIFEDVENAYKKEFASLDKNSDMVEEIAIADILPNPYQPRQYFDKEALKELSESIKRHGLIQPIIVIKKDDGYMLIAGERRYRATKMLGQSHIKAIVADMSSQNLREIALIENIQRENLNPIELANSYKELINEYKITQDGLSSIIHKSRTQITNTMRLLLLSEQTQQLLREDRLTQGHAKVIVGLSVDDEKMVVDTILGQKLSVRDTENLVQKLKNNTIEKKRVTAIAKEYSDGLNRLKDVLDGLKIKSKIKSKKLILEFESAENIDKFIKILK